ncbi:MAG: flavodoxin-dependent (E)-4-hydroxy-3-methylbut-2-enyl-diphosphate synthase, partial [Cyclobacteriaceae bacterium]|nr:flavodoxin-dependent (E)-4-hydroxy-3-methylbut-2-enyl-diphosphate synthase [Cyclobacteriaceae bacterium]
NHGSLSDRILSRYGDTPLGMVESALEFLRICEDENYYSIVLSMKASNPQVMIQAYRLLVSKLKEENLKPYPLHLGVTEAGEGEDGRIKSALGIGALLEDGLGDTVRVSLTEEPEFEAPVARDLVNRSVERKSEGKIAEIDFSNYSPYEYKIRETDEVYNVGGGNVPRVVADFSRKEIIEVKDLKNIGHFYLSATDKWSMNDMGADFIYTGNNPIRFMLPNGLKEICDLDVYNRKDDKKNTFPYIKWEEIQDQLPSDTLNFVEVNARERDLAIFNKLDKRHTVLVVYTDNTHGFAAFRAFFMFLKNNHLLIPVVLKCTFDETEERIRLFASTDVGGLLTDGFGNGVMIHGGEDKFNNQLAFGVLQASRTRISKTEYISCPSCGRTLFDLQQTTALIRKKTDHLKGLKIGIMGCIVNGPGEMADADYGYVGSGIGKITLYRGQTVVKRAVPSVHAVDELIDIIKEDGNWVEPEKMEMSYE